MSKPRKGNSVSESSTPGRAARRLSDDEPVQVRSSEHVITGSTVTSDDPVAPTPAKPSAEPPDDSRELILRVVRRALAIVEQSGGNRRLSLSDKTVLEMAARTCQDVAQQFQSALKPTSRRTSSRKGSKR